MSYSVSRQNHSKHGNVIEIVRSDSGEHETPFQAYQKAKLMRRLWMEADGNKVRILIDSQVMTVSQAERWSYDEHKILPKCQGCAKILNGEVYNHQLCSSGLFCTQNCADKDYVYQMEKLNDNDESDCF